MCSIIVACFPSHTFSMVSRIGVRHLSQKGKDCHAMTFWLHFLELGDQLCMSFVYLVPSPCGVMSAALASAEMPEQERTTLTQWELR